MDGKRYAIDIGPRILEYYESYFSIDYPLSKQDMAAIPDFAAGNFNLNNPIFTRRTCLSLSYYRCYGKLGIDHV
jgi:aminopeptidase N